MSNRSRMPASARQGVIPQGRQAGKATGFLSQLAERTQQAATEMQNGEPEEDLNVLPFPESQNISDTGIEWVWPVFGSTIFVYGFLFTRDVDSAEGNVKDNTYRHGKKGDYIVQLKMPGNHEVWGISDCAKELGQAMVSASNWVNIWKDHAGMFLEKQLLGPGTDLSIVTDE